MITTINPANGSRLNSYKIMSEHEVLNAIDFSYESHKEWRALSVRERLERLVKLKKHILFNKRKYAELMTNEMGKIVRESVAEVEKCAWLIDELRSHAEQWLADEHIQADGLEHVITYAPLGPIYIIMPWNFPFWQVFKVALPPLVAGNTVLLKHARNVTGTALEIEQAFRDAGILAGVFQTLVVNHDTSARVISNTKVAAVSITGSVNSGRTVGAESGKEIKKVVMELGGSDPFIVMEDADIDAAVKGALFGRTTNCGQVCTGSKRFIIHESVAREFSSKLIDVLKNRKLGDPLDPDTEIGPLVNREAVQTMHSFLDDAVKKGAVLETGGKIEGNGCYFAPAVLTEVTTDMRVMKEETFGPIAPVIRFKTEEEALAIANDTVFGLNGSIWSGNIDNAGKIARKLEVGGVTINGFSRSHPLLPLGGIKLSGYGRELGKHGIREFTNIKLINIYDTDK